MPDAFADSHPEFAVGPGGADQCSGLGTPEAGIDEHAPTRIYCTPHVLGMSTRRPFQVLPLSW